MKLITSVLILALTGTALAQASAQKNAAPAANAKNKPAATSAKPRPAPGKTFTAAAKHAATAVKPAAKPAQERMAAKSVKPVAKKASTPAEPAAGDQQKRAQAKIDTKNRRDPFVSVVMSREGPPCAGGGKKCIAIDQVTLQGVVRAPNGSIAVVSSGARKTYFLRENDPVYNGVVVKISPDSIVFRETVMDRLGKTSQREVVKRIQNTPAA